jgi:hypothetical protein
VGAGADLLLDLDDGRLRELLEERVRGLRLGVEHRLEPGEPLAPALDRVAGDGERPADEADQRHAPREPGVDGADAVEDVRQVLLRLRDPERVDVGARADRVGDLRAAVPLALLPLLEREVEPHRREVDEDVREEDRRVEADLVDRRDRHLGDQLGRAAELEEPDLLADGAVARLVAAGLAHHPDGEAVDGLAAAGAEEAGVLDGHGGVAIYLPSPPAGRGSG